MPFLLPEAGWSTFPPGGSWNKSLKIHFSDLFELQQCSMVPGMFPDPNQQWVNNFHHWDRVGEPFPPSGILHTWKIDFIYLFHLQTCPMVPGIFSNPNLQCG
jgi:hypothetical protein